jgi:hypothetical protein
MTEQMWGAPAPEQPRRPWSARRVVIAAGAAVVLVVGGTTAVIAATNGNASTGGGPGGGAPFAGATVANALHGDFVVADGNGYARERLQTGTVTAVSSASITVRSTDGYTGTYVVDSGTTVDQGADPISKVATGNTVTTTAKLAGQQATATSIEDTTIDTRARRGGPGGFGGTPPDN